jgi:hypothetical protein
VVVDQPEPPACSILLWVGVEVQQAIFKLVFQIHLWLPNSQDSLWPGITQTITAQQF